MDCGKINNTAINPSTICTARYSFSQGNDAICKVFCFIFWLPKRKLCLKFWEFVISHGSIPFYSYIDVVLHGLFRLSESQSPNHIILLQNLHVKTPVSCFFTKDINSRSIQTVNEWSMIYIYSCHALRYIISGQYRVLVSTLCGSCNTWVISIWYVISRYTGCVIMAPDFACILFSGNVCNGSNDTGNPFVMTRMVEQDNSRKYGAGPYIAFLETTNMPSNTVFIWPHRQNQFTWMPQAK